MPSTARYGLRLVHRDAESSKAQAISDASTRQKPLSQDDPDADLLTRLGKQEPDAVREMVARKLPRLLSLATRMLGDRSEAEDVAQEVFVRIWQHASHWQSGTARFDTWLHRVALNLCYDRLRKQREIVLDDLPEPTDPAPALDDALADAARGERVAAALATLPVRQREALVLQYYQELSNAQTAELMDITIEALESLLARARRNLRLSLANERGDHANQGKRP